METRTTNGLDGANYRPPTQESWQGRIDGQAPGHLRWHQYITLVDLGATPIPDLSGMVVLLGFACDEGVRRNKGRTGARKGPGVLRNMLANQPIHNPAQRIADAGDVSCPDGNLERAQSQLALAVQAILRGGGFPILLGGGHEITFGHYQGIQQATGKPVGVVNFDAHFDNRSIQGTGPSSGTGFWQIAEAYQPDYRDFNYLAIGIQPTSNTQALFATAKETKTKYILAGDLHAGKQAATIQKIDAILQRSAGIYVTIDLDVFAAAHAPGVSAPAYIGIAPDDVFFICLNRILDSGQAVSVDIAELNPDFDIDNRTARLATAIIDHITCRLSRSKKD